MQIGTSGPHGYATVDLEVQEVAHSSNCFPVWRVCVMLMHFLPGKRNASLRFVGY